MLMGEIIFYPLFGGNPKFRPSCSKSKEYSDLGTCQGILAVIYWTTTMCQGIFQTSHLVYKDVYTGIYIFL